MLPDTAHFGKEDHIVGHSSGLTTSRSVRLSSGNVLPPAGPVRFAQQTPSSSGGSRSGTPRRRQTGYHEQTAPAAGLANFRQPSLEVLLRVVPRGVPPAVSRILTVVKQSKPHYILNLQVQRSQ